MSKHYIDLSGGPIDSFDGKIKEIAADELVELINEILGVKRTAYKWPSALSFR